MGRFYGNYREDFIRFKFGKMCGSLLGGERVVKIYVFGRGEYFVEIMNSEVKLKGG